MKMEMNYTCELHLLSDGNICILNPCLEMKTVIYKINYNFTYKD